MRSLLLFVCGMVAYGQGQTKTLDTPKFPVGCTGTMTVEGCRKYVDDGTITINGESKGWATLQSPEFVAHSFTGPVVVYDEAFKKEVSWIIHLDKQEVHLTGEEVARALRIYRAIQNMSAAAVESLLKSADTEKK